MSIYQSDELSYELVEWDFLYGMYNAFDCGFYPLTEPDCIRKSTDILILLHSNTCV